MMILDPFMMMIIQHAEMIVLSMHAIHVILNLPTIADLKVTQQGLYYINNSINSIFNQTFFRLKPAVFFSRIDKFRAFTMNHTSISSSSQLPCTSSEQQECTYDSCSTSEQLSCMQTEGFFVLNY